MTKNNATKAQPVETVEAVVIPSLADYQSADRDGKAAIRKAVQVIRDEAIDSLDLATAKAAKEALESYAPAKAAKAEVDYQSVLSRRITVLEEAASMLRNGGLVPEGFPEDFTFDVVAHESVTYTDEQRGEIVSEAVKVGGAKVTRSGSRNDIEAAIVAAFEDQPSGTFYTCTEIANKQGLPSSGAVSARWEGWDHADVTATRKDGSPTGTKGYVKN